MEDQQYVFEMIVTERAKTIIPVLAKDAVEAKEKFDLLRDKNPKLLQDALENGYEGYEIHVSPPKNAEEYPLDDILGGEEVIYYELDCNKTRVARPEDGSI